MRNPPVSNGGVPADLRSAGGCAGSSHYIVALIAPQLSILTHSLNSSIGITILRLNRSAGILPSLIILYKVGRDTPNISAASDIDNARFFIAIILSVNSFSISNVPQKQIMSICSSLQNSQKAQNTHLTIFRRRDILYTTRYSIYLSIQ